MVGVVTLPCRCSVAGGNYGGCRADRYGATPEQAANIDMLVDAAVDLRHALKARVSLTASLAACLQTIHWPTQSICRRGCDRQPGMIPLCAHTVLVGALLGALCVGRLHGGLTVTL
jgi:hypothetical protein